MAWIELHQSLVRHPKTLRVAAALRVSEETVIGHMATLWCWALDAKPQGGPLSDLDVRAGANWKARSDITAALVEAGFLDSQDDGYWLHDWPDYAGRLIRQRELAKERARKARASNANGTDTVRAPYAHGTRNVREQFAPTQPDRTEPNTTEPSVSLSREQEELRADLHGKARDRIFGGRNAPDSDWCEDLIRRGMTANDADEATRASSRKSLAYCRAVLLRRIEEREAGNDPDRVPERETGAAARGSHVSGVQQGRLAGNRGRPGEAADDFDDLPPHAIRADGGDLRGSRSPARVPGEAAGDRITPFPGRDRASGGAR